MSLLATTGMSANASGANASALEASTAESGGGDGGGGGYGGVDVNTSFILQMQLIGFVLSLIAMGTPILQLLEQRVVTPGINICLKNKANPLVLLAAAYMVAVSLPRMLQRLIISADAGAVTSAQAAQSASADAGDDAAGEEQSVMAGDGGDGGEECCDDDEACVDEEPSVELTAGMVADVGTRTSRLLARAVAAKEVAAKNLQPSVALPPLVEHGASDESSRSGVGLLQEMVQAHPAPCDAYARACVWPTTRARGNASGDRLTCASLRCRVRAARRGDAACTAGAPAPTEGETIDGRRGRRRRRRRRWRRHVSKHNIRGPRFSLARITGRVVGGSDRAACDARDVSTWGGAKPLRAATCRATRPLRPCHTGGSSPSPGQGLQTAPQEPKSNIELARRCCNTVWR